MKDTVRYFYVAAEARMFDNSFHFTASMFIDVHGGFLNLEKTRHSFQDDMWIKYNKVVPTDIIHLTFLFEFANESDFLKFQEK